jgi:hypothetical protein
MATPITSKQQERQIDEIIADVGLRAVVEYLATYADEMADAADDTAASRSRDERVKDVADQLVEGWKDAADKLDKVARALDVD